MFAFITNYQADMEAMLDDVEWRVQYLENLLVETACLKKVPLSIFYNEKVALAVSPSSSIIAYSPRSRSNMAYMSATRTGP